MGTKTKVALTLFFTVLLVAVVAIAVYAYTSWGNEQIRSSIEESFSGGERQLKIERIGDFRLFSPPGVVWMTADGIRLVGPEDQQLFAVGEVTTALDLGGLWSRTLHFREVRIGGAEIPVDRETGYPKVGVPKSRKAFEPRAMSAQLDNVELGLYLVDQTPEGEKVIVGRLHAEFQASVPADMPGVRMTLRNAKGVIAQPEAIEVLDASGEIDTSATKVADLRFTAIARGAAISGGVVYIPSDPEHPIQPSVENVRDAGVLNNPMDTLKGMGLPMDDIKGFIQR